MEAFAGFFATSHQDHGLALASILPHRGLRRESAGSIRGDFRSFLVCFVDSPLKKHVSDYWAASGGTGRNRRSPGIRSRRIRREESLPR